MFLLPPQRIPLFPLLSCLSAVLLISGCGREGTTNDEDGSSPIVNRSEEGLLVLYRFLEGQGDIVEDLSGVEPPLPLAISRNEKNEIAWVSGGGIRATPEDYKIDVSSMVGTLSSAGPATKIIDAIKTNGSFSVEIWGKPTNVEQLGPVRLVSISGGNGSRNVTIGHAGPAYDFRIRTTKVNKNGLPSLRTKDSFQAKAELTHIVLTYSDSGGKVYIDGELVDWFFYEGVEPGPDLIGGLENWDDSFPLILFNETSGDRAWTGELYLVAFYDRALDSEEVMQNLHAKF